MESVMKSKLFVCKFFFSCLVLFAFTCQLCGTEYFVSPSGKDSFPGSREKPFATFKKGLSVLKPGDILTLTPGDYAGAGDLNLAGTKGKPILIRAAIPGTAVIRGDREVKGFKLCAGERFIYELPWDEQTGGVKERDTLSWYDPVKTFELLRYNRAVWFHDVKKKKLYVVTSDGKAPDTHVMTVCTGDPREGHGLQLLGKSSYLHFDGLTFTGFDSYVIKWENRYYSVKSLYFRKSSNMKVTNCRFFLNGCGLTGNTVKNILVENCVSYANYSLADGSAANIYFVSGTNENCIVRNCTTFKSRLSGIRFYAATTPGCVIEKCVSWGHGVSDLQVKPPDKRAVIRECVALKDATTHTVRNNIIAGNVFRPKPQDDPTSLYWTQKGIREKMQYNLADWENFDGRPMSDSTFKGGLPYDKTVYFLAPDGKDTNSGTTIRAPRKSLKNIPDGSTVYLMPGKYGKLLISQKNLTLAGRGRYTQALVAGGDITTSNVTVRKVNFSAPVAVKGNNVTFENCSFAENLNFRESKDFRVIHCAFVKGTVEAVQSSGAVFSNILAKAVKKSASIYSDNNAYPDRVPAGEKRSFVCKALFNAPEKGNFTLKNAQSFAGRALDAFPVGPWNRVPGLPDGKILYPVVYRTTPDSAEIQWHLPAGKEECHISWKEKKGGRWMKKIIRGEGFRNVTLTDLKPGTGYICRISGSHSNQERFLNIEPTQAGEVAAELAFTTPVKAQAPREYFVAVNGSDRNPGTLEKPFRTITHALDHICPGDTVTVRGGRYFEKLMFKVSDMTLRGMPGEKVLLDGERKLMNLISFYHKRNITIDNFRMRGVITTNDSYIHCISSSDIKLKRLFIDGRWADGYSPTALFAVFCNNILFENSVSMNAFRGFHLIACDGIRVRNCVLALNSLNQIHFSSFSEKAKAVIENNIVCDTIAGKPHNSIFFAEPVHPGLKIENNCFYIRTDAEKRNFVGTWYGKWSGIHPIAHYRKTHPVAKETNIFKDPVMAGLKLHKAPFPKNVTQIEYRATADGKSWQELDFKDFFPADAEVRKRNMGLREKEIR